MKADHRTMPKGTTRNGETPHDEVLLADSHALALLAARQPKARADESLKFRFSAATGCARQAGYQMTDTPETNPRTEVDVFVMGIGTLLHDEVQRSIMTRYWGYAADGTRDGAYGPGTAEMRAYVDSHTRWGLVGHCEFEVKCTIPGLGSGHADIWLPHGLPGTSIDGVPTVVELKTKGGFGYKMQVGDRGDAEGPAWSAKVQGALCAEALGAELLIVATVATEAISVGQAERKGIPHKHRAFAEWRYTRDEWQDWVTLEQNRVHRIMALVADGTLPPRAISEPGIPPRARVIDVRSGAMLAEKDGKTVWTGKAWNCAYCSWQDRCERDGPS
jgi:hypothetical protein